MPIMQRAYQGATGNTGGIDPSMFSNMTGTTNSRENTNSSNESNSRRGPRVEEVD
jgi:hypothetical protein